MCLCESVKKRTWWLEVLMLLSSKTTEESSLITSNTKCLKGFSSTKGKNGEIPKKVLNLCMWLQWNSLVCCSYKTSGCFLSQRPQQLDIPLNFRVQNYSWDCLLFQKLISEHNNPAFKSQSFLVCSLPGSQLFYCYLLCITTHRNINFCHFL